MNFCKEVADFIFFFFLKKKKHNKALILQRLWILENNPTLFNVGGFSFYAEASQERTRLYYWRKKEREKASTSTKATHPLMNNEVDLTMAFSGDER